VVAAAVVVVLVVEKKEEEEEEEEGIMFHTSAEAWMPGRKSFGEISSASSCGDYQVPPPLPGVSCAATRATCPSRPL
jgi:hypothetical protein